MGFHIKKMNISHFDFIFAEVGPIEFVKGVGGFEH